MITCKELAARAARGEFEEAGAAVRLQVLFHLLICSGCRRLKRQLAAISAAARALSEPSPSRLAAFEGRLLAIFRP